jgi:hypothetical protein
MQQTPTGHKIPVPKRNDVFGDLAKIAKPVRPDDMANWPLTMLRSDAVASVPDAQYGSPTEETAP